jgi:uncharacterized repeat protein (TIGR03803 family)
MSKLSWGMRACGFFLLWATTAIALSAQTFETLHSFDGTDGSYPSAALVQATNGKFYGTTGGGGPNGQGTVFKITPNGTLTTLHSFNFTDGYSPYAALVQAANGEFYGTTQFGGANSACGSGIGCGTVFKITLSGNLTALYSFCSQTNCTDGSEPYAGLVQATDGNLYGTTLAGGANDDGTVFKITRSGTLTTLHSFDYTGGYLPDGGLVQGTNRKFYGTTRNGGANDDGTVFSITAGGTLNTLHSFDRTDGAEPAGLVQGTNGDFYGITGFGGANSSCGQGAGCGTVFKITPSGNLTMLHSFDGTDGYNPVAALIQGTDGKFYGTTQFGGANNACNNQDAGCGTVFEMAPSGKLTTLYSFCSQTNCTDGGGPLAALVQATSGKFYGTTEGGGANRAGTVFSLSVNLK